MALLKKVGNFLTQSTSNPSLFAAVRSMSTSSKIFVGGLSYSTDDTSLSDTFSKYGEVVEAKVIIDRNTGRSKGFAFVTFTSTEAASSAIQAFDGQELHGRRIKVNYATEKSRSGGFGGGFGAGFGSSDGYNYDGPGGDYGGGRFQGGGFGGSGGGNYAGGDGDYSKSGGFGGSGGGNYAGGDGDYSRSGGFGSGNQYPSRGGGSGGNDNLSSGGGAQGNGNWGGGESNYYASQSGSSFSSNSETAGSYGNNQGQLGDDHEN